DIFIMPSRFGYWNNSWKGEGFGIVYVEAALFGIPSIAYRCGGVTDIIEDQKNGILVEPDNVEELAEAIIGLGQDKQRIVELGESARKMALQQFTPEKIQLEMKNAFNSYPFWNLETA
ncbi:MAG: glycosyltransferase family 4 protein, partial [Deltaproteobacteria bacterium]|nr:glycosyltransferase family 4 protein [Deltaproteobacteria bacterium]